MTLPTDHIYQTGKQKMTTAQRLCHDVLEERVIDIIGNMNPGKVANELVKGTRFNRTDRENVVYSSEPTSGKNQILLNIIQKRGLNGLTEFICSLTSVDEEHRILAETLQPVKYRILWVCTCPVHAAAVVHVLKGSFCKMQRIGKDFNIVLRRGRVFRKEFTEKEFRDMKDSEQKLMAKQFHEVEVCLVFPAIEKDAPSDIIEEVFKEKLVSDVNLVVLGKISDLDREEKTGYVISNAVTLDRNEKILQQGPTKDILPQVWKVDNVKEAAMHSKSYKKSFDDAATLRPDTEVLDFDSTVLSFYAMCSHYPATRNVPSLACVSAKILSSTNSEVDESNSRTLMNIVRCYYNHSSISTQK